MFLNVLRPEGLVLLRKILAAPPVPNAYLAGGTALALMLGHRESIDFDWFTPDRFEPGDVADHLAEMGRLRIAETKRGSFHGFVDGIRVTWLYYPNPLLDRLQTPPEVPGLRLASLTDIAVMKWAALSSRGSRKDFIDLYFIARAGLEVSSLVPLLDKKYPGSDINLYHMVKSLSYFDDAEDEAWPVIHTPVRWQEVKMYFQRQQGFLLDRYL